MTQEQKLQEDTNDLPPIDDMRTELKEAGDDFDKRCAIYRRYVSPAETWEERRDRINAFRCGGR